MAWEIDGTHSQATFSVRHMMVSTVRGQFGVLGGKLEIDEQHPENSWIEAEVDAASIDTRDARRDGHLRSAKDLYGMERAGLSAKTKVNRKDFDLNWNKALETGGVLVGDDVTIEIDLAAVRKSEVLA